jgi:sugar lactone lactonase YvrE
MKSGIGVLAAAALLEVVGMRVLAQPAADPGNDLPNPYQTAVRNWAKLPDGRTWGSTAGIEIGLRNEIWAIDRCGVNTCDGSNLPPVHLLDLSTGKPIKSIGAGLFVFPHGLHVDRDGNVWVTDALSSKDGTKGQQVIKLSPDGKVLMRLGTAGVAGGGPTHFNEPSDVVTSNGDIFVADGHSGQNPDVPADYITRIIRFSKDGTFIKEWGKLGSGPGEFRNAHALAIDSAGRLFVCDRGNARIQIFSPDGKFLEQWSQFGRPSGLYIDQNDKLYVMDADSTAANHAGWKKGIRIGSAKDGKVVAFVPGHQTESPDGAAGEGIVADAAGNLYAAENTLRGVTKYAKR